MEKIVPVVLIGAGVTVFMFGAGFVMPALGIGVGTELIAGSLVALGLLSAKG